MKLVYTGQFENFYAHPLNAEARACEVDRELVVDQHLLRAGSGVVRLARVREVRDVSDGRRVTFQEVAQS